jgi:hypothetical protein
MATATFDLTGLALLEQTIGQMIAAQAAGTANFVGGAPFTATYSLWPSSTQGPAPASGSMTTSQLQQRLLALKASFDRLPL